MANTNFKIDNGLLVTGGDSLFQGSATVNGTMTVRQSLAVNGNLTVSGNLEYANTSIDGNLVPTANGKALGNTTRTFDVFAGNINVANSIITANGVEIGIRAGSGIVANATGIIVNASSVSNGVLNIGQGGTNGSTRAAGLNNLLPVQNAAVNGYFLRTGGVDASWVDGIGFTGSKGDKGDRGDVGFTGSQGGVGFTGSAGSNGFDGSRGDVGFTGSKGDKGDRGDVGFTGSKGTDGTNAAGFTGSRGDVGFTGSKGDIGFTGSASTVVGYTGSKGDIGFTGSASTVIGYTGSKGDIGFTGSASTVVGFTGSKGDVGFTGSASTVVGFTGSKGDTGFTGSGYGTSASVQMGSLGVGTAASGTSGEIRATNEITAYYTSDKTFKNNIVPIENALAKLRMITGVMFDWSDEYIESRGGVDGYFVRKHDTGIIAQDVEKVLPEVVAVREDGTLAVKYEKMMGLIVQAINELADDVDKLKG